MPTKKITGAGDKTCFQAMAAFTEKCREIGCSPIEIALFHTLLSTWNSARRPDVFSVWEDTGTALMSCSSNTYTKARAGLIEKGIIYFNKQGRRAKPKYSLNAINKKTNPFLCSEFEHDSNDKCCHNGEHKVSIEKPILTSKEVKKHPSKKTGKPPLPPRGGTEPASEQFASPDMDVLKARINSLRPTWAKPAQWSHAEEHGLFGGVSAQMAELDGNDWEVLKQFLNAHTDKGAGYWQPRNRSKFVETFSDVWQSAERWKSKTNGLAATPNNRLF